MMQLMISLLLLAAAPATAPTRSPTTVATTGRAVRPPAANPMELHTRAYDLMRGGDIKKASVEIEKAYKAVSAEQRNRALVLNRAIVDIKQRTYIMRALKDLTQYLTKHRDPDELATNILGGALNVAVAENPKLKSGELWQSAFREWDRRNYVLDHSRKGWRRWGMRWVTEAEYAKIQGEIQGLKQAVEDQREVANRAYDRAWSISQQYTNAVNAVEKNRYLIQYLQWYNGSYKLPQRLNRDPSSPNYGQFDTPQIVTDYTSAYLEAQRLGPEMEVAMRELNREAVKLRQLETKIIRPEWPTQFDPVDPGGAEADKPLPTTNPAPTSAPAAEKPFLPGFKPLPPVRGAR
jgi:hypothetical protein